MNADMKLFATKCALVGGMLTVIIGGGFAIKSYSDARVERRKQEDHQLAQLYIKDMVAVCNFGNMDKDELERLQKCGDDVEQARLFLTATLQDRISFWNGSMANCEERFSKIQDIRRSASYWDYQNEKTYIEVRTKILNDYATAKEQRTQFIAVKEAFEKWTPADALIRQKPQPKENAGKV